MTDLAVALLAGIAAYRVWRLLGLDDVSVWVRSWMPGVVAWWLECRWCSGTWWAFAVVYAADWQVPLERPWLAALGAATVVGLLPGADEV